MGLLHLHAVLLFTVAWAAAVNGQQTVHHFSYRGCYADYLDSTRDLGGLFGFSTIGPYTVDPVGGWVFSISYMTIKLCSHICSIGGFRYFSVQATAFCFCGHTYGLHGAAPESACYRVCTGNASEICGGSDRNSVYENLFNPATGVYKPVSSNASVLWSLPAAVHFECPVRLLASRRGSG